MPHNLKIYTSEMEVTLFATMNHCHHSRLLEITLAFAKFYNRLYDPCDLLLLVATLFYTNFSALLVDLGVSVS